MAHFLAEQKNGDTLVFSSSAAHHIRHVMRLKKGDEFEGVYEGKVYAVQVVSLDPFEAKIIHEILEDRELEGRLTLAFALLKGGHDEFILQKGTELGVYAFIPFSSERTIIRFKNEKEKEARKARYEKILSSSSEQCRRSFVPECKGIVSLKELALYPAKTKLFAYEMEAESGKPIQEAFSDDTLLLIGPEGGFSKEEASYLLLKGFTAVSLGRRILRAETAAIYGASLYAEHYEKR